MLNVRCLWCYPEKSIEQSDDVDLERPGAHVAIEMETFIQSRYNLRDSINNKIIVLITNRS